MIDLNTSNNENNETKNNPSDIIIDKFYWIKCENEKKKHFSYLKIFMKDNEE